MFPSIFGCTIGTTVSSTFVATSTLSISVGNDVTLFKNGVNVGHLCNCVSGDTISASVTSPFTRGTPLYVPYYINGLVSYFVVIARTSDDYLDPQYAAKRWPNFIPSNKQYLTLSTSNGQIEFDVGWHADRALPDEVHVILDPPTKRAAFYDSLSRLISTSTFDSEPTSWARVKSASTDYFLICLNDGSIVKLLPSLTKSANALASAKNTAVGTETDWLFELPFETDIPMAGSIVNFAAYKMRLADSKLPHVISYSNGFVWVGGYKKAWKFDESLSLVSTITFPSRAVAIQSLGDNVLIANRYGAVMHFADGVRTDVLETGWIGNFVRIGLGNVYFCDAVSSRLYGFNPVSQALTTQFQFDDTEFPSYVATDGTRFYVTFHDSRKSATLLGSSRTDKSFTKRVTYVSATSNSRIYGHYLEFINTVIHTARPESRTFPIISSTVGRPASTAEFVISTFGHTLTLVPEPIGASEVKMWVNGQIANEVNDGDVVSFSIMSGNPFSAYPVILGEGGFDIMVSNYTSGVMHAPKPKNAIDAVSEWQFAFTSEYDNAIVSVDHGTVPAIRSTSTGVMTGNCMALSENAVISLSIGASTSYVYVDSAFTEYKETLLPLASKAITVTLAPGTYTFPFHGDFSVTAIQTNPYGPVTFTSPVELAVSFTASSLEYEVREYVVKGTENIRFTFIASSAAHFDQISVSSSAQPRESILLGPYTLSGNSDVTVVTDPNGNVTSATENPQTLIASDGIKFALTDPEYVGVSWLTTDSSLLNGSQFWIKVDTTTSSKYNLFQIMNDGSKFPLFDLSVAISQPEFSVVEHISDHSIDESAYEYFYHINSTCSIQGLAGILSTPAMLESSSRLDGLAQQEAAYSDTGLSGIFNSEQRLTADGLQGGVLTSENSSNSAGLAGKFFTIEDQSSQVQSFAEAFGNSASSFVWASSHETDSYLSSESFKFKQFSSEFFASEKFKSVKETLQHFVKDAFESIHRPDAEKMSLVFASQKAIYSPVLWTPSQISWSVQHQNEKTSNHFASWVSSDNFRSSAQFTKFIAALNAYGVDTFKTMVTMSLDRSSSVFKSNLMTDHLMTSDSFDYDPMIASNKLAPQLLVLIDDPHILRLVSAEILPSNPILYKIDGLSSENDLQIAWVAGPDQNYGAFPTQSDAEAAAIRRGITKHVLIQMDDGLWTYRELSDISASCGLNPKTGNIHAIFGLIKGG